MISKLVLLLSIYKAYIIVDQHFAEYFPLYPFNSVHQNLKFHKKQVNTSWEKCFFS